QDSARPGCRLKSPRTSIAITGSNKEGNTRLPTLVCSRNVASVPLFVIPDTATRIMRALLSAPLRDCAHIALTAVVASALVVQVNHWRRLIFMVIGSFKSWKEHQSSIRILHTCCDQMMFL